MNRGDAEAQSDLLSKALTEQIIGAAIEVHRVLGPGLLESAYEECLCHELTLRKLKFVRQVPVPVEYKGVKLDCGYRLDLLVEDRVILELKCVERLMPVHEAQLMTYLQLTDKKVGLIFNFHTSLLTRGGMVRKVLEKEKYLRASASPRSS
jgi:GxxExxY protein